MTAMVTTEPDIKKHLSLNGYADSLIGQIIANKNLITRFVIQVDKMTILFRDEVAKIGNIRGRIEALEMISQNHTEVFRELFGIEPKEVDMLGKVCEPTTQYNV